LTFTGGFDAENYAKSLIVLAEAWSPKPGVAGSSPATPAIISIT
jgi:hypothetical protein